MAGNKNDAKPDSGLYKLIELYGMGCVATLICSCVAPPKACNFPPRFIVTSVKAIKKPL